MNPALKQSARDRASICRIFGSTHRVLIAWVLGEDEMTVSDIAEAVDTSLQNISQHLRLMKDKGILQSRREGRSIYYRVADNVITQKCPIFEGENAVQLRVDHTPLNQKENDDG